MKNTDNLIFTGKGFSGFKTKGFSGFNLDRNVYIRCKECGDLISMHPRNAERCSCGNITKDIDNGMIECKTGIENIEVYKEKKQKSGFRIFG
ncbi:MAG: hypothetical protein J1F64_07995 [Oscillospiraceae bacterium]|nr:hypothetical protein [Oscillospiraceae bacterium]